MYSIRVRSTVEQQKNYSINCLLRNGNSLEFSTYRETSDAISRDKLCTRKAPGADITASILHVKNWSIGPTHIYVCFHLRQWNQDQMQAVLYSKSYSGDQPASQHPAYTRLFTLRW